jgi:hypothetical protein
LKPLSLCSPLKDSWAVIKKDWVVPNVGLQDLKKKKKSLSRAGILSLIPRLSE